MNRSLLVDLRVYLADDLAMRNLLSNRDPFESPTGQYVERVLPLPAAMSAPIALDLLPGNQVTILRTSAPVTIVLTTGSGGSAQTLSVQIQNQFVFSANVTGLTVRNTDPTAATDLVFIQQ